MVSALPLGTSGDDDHVQLPAGTTTVSPLAAPAIAALTLELAQDAALIVAARACGAARKLASTSANSANTAFHSQASGRLFDRHRASPLRAKAAVRCGTPSLPTSARGTTLCPTANSMKFSTCQFN